MLKKKERVRPKNRWEGYRQLQIDMRWQGACEEDTGD